MYESRDAEDRLAEVLASVGRHLVVQPVAGAVGAVPPRRRTGRLVLAAAIVVAVVAAAVLAIAPARRTVGGWLRGGTVEVHLDPSIEIPPALPAFTDDAVRIDPADAAAILGGSLPDLSGTELGPPAEWSTAPEGGVVAGFGDGVTSLWLSPAADGVTVEKIAMSATRVADLPELGDGGVAVAGEHVLQTEIRTVVADSVVAWTDGAMTYRLESTRSIDELIEIARQLAQS